MCSGRKSPKLNCLLQARDDDGNIWDQVLARIETKVNRHSFYTWFKPTSFVADGGARSRSACRTCCSGTG